MEDRILYPALEASANKTLAGSYLNFAAKWNTPRLLEAEPETFRDEANQVLKALYERMQREDREFYPAIEAL
ncbi:hypothetical protein [Duganella sp.]|uniref:hypothetical protein n=1 Tax=Duganella sp. TaxID=1904440 RepID=UPI0031E06EC6